MSIEHVEIGEIVTEPTLDELATTINQEHRLVLADLGSVTAHAVTCGLELIEVQRRLPYGQWEKWKVEHLDMADDTAGVYMRLAEFRHLIGPGDSITEARRIISALAPGRISRRGPGHANVYGGDFEKDVRRLRDQGLSIRKIASLVNAAPSTVRFRLDGEYRKRVNAQTLQRKRQRKELHAALRRQRQDEAVKARGGPPAEAYSLIRKCLQILDRELANAESPEERGAWRSALAAAHQVEDGIVAALKLEGTR